MRKLKYKRLWWTGRKAMRRKRTGERQKRRGKQNKRTKESSSTIHKPPSHPPLDSCGRSLFFFFFFFFFFLLPETNEIILKSEYATILLHKPCIPYHHPALHAWAYICMCLGSIVKGDSILFCANGLLLGAQCCLLFDWRLCPD